MLSTSTLRPSTVPSETTVTNIDLTLNSIVMFTSFQDTISIQIFDTADFSFLTPTTTLGTTSTSCAKTSSILCTTSNDLATPSTLQAATSSAQTQTSSPSVNSTDVNNLPDSASHTTRLSAGAIAGIAVGSVFGLVLLLLCVLFAFGFRICRSKIGATGHVIETPPKPGLEDTNCTRRLDTLHNGTQPELEGTVSHPELEGNATVLPRLQGVEASEDSRRPSRFVVELDGA